MAISNIEIKVKGFLRTALAAEAATTTIDVDFVNEDDPSTAVLLQSDTLMFEIDPLNKTGKGSEICLAASKADDTPSTNRTRFSTVVRGLPKYGAGQTGSATLAKSWDEGTEVAIATGSMAKMVNLLLSYLTTNPSDTTYSGDLTFSGTDTFTGSFRFPVYATTTARDVAITSPVNGMVAYVTADAVLYQYIGGAWATFATGTVVAAADHTAGKVDIASATEIGAGTAEDATSGAINVIPVSQTVKTSSGAADENKLPVLGSGGMLATGFMPTNLQEGNTFFGATDLTGAEAETLSASSDATALHYHDLIKNDILSGREYINMAASKITAASGTATDSGGEYVLTCQAAANAIAEARIITTNSVGDLSGKSPIFSITLKFTATTAQEGFIGCTNTTFDGISLENSVLTLDHFGFVIEDGTIYGSCADGTTQQKTAALGTTLTTIHQYSGVFTGGVCTFYIDGVSVGTLNTNVPNGTMASTLAAVIADATNAAKSIYVTACGGVSFNRA